MPVKHILVATGGSTESLSATLVAGDLARTFDASVSVVTVHSERILTLPAISAVALPSAVRYTPFPKKEAKKHI